MIKVELLVGILSFALWVFCLIDVVSSDESRIRNLKKLWWLLLVLFFPLVGSIAWLAVGRPTGPSTSHHGRPDFPEYDRPGRFVATDEGQDEDFLRRVRERAEEQRARHEAERRRREQQEGNGLPPDQGPA